MPLTALQRAEIRSARDAAVREGWNPSTPKASEIPVAALLDALDTEQARSAREIGSRFGIVGAGHVSHIGRVLARQPEVEVVGNRARRQFRLVSPPRDT